MAQIQNEKNKSSIKAYPNAFCKYFIIVSINQPSNNQKQPPEVFCEKRCS